MTKRIFVSMPELASLKGGNKELYVVSIATDLRQMETPINIVGANNSDVLHIAPKIAENALLKFLVMSASTIFEHIRPGFPVPLLGDGIILYPDLDPKGLLGLDVFVIESDEGHRRIGKLLEAIVGNKAVMGEIEKLTTVPVLNSELIGSLMRAAVTAIPQIIKSSGDDMLFHIGFSGTSRRNYGLQPGIQEVQTGNEFVSCTLRFDVEE